MKKLLVLLLLTACAFSSAFSQEEEEKLPEGWTWTAGIGLDLAQLLQINPRVGAGQNRIALGGALNGLGRYRKGRFAWDNTASWQFGVQQIGVGKLPSGGNIPIQKNIDEFRINSKAGYRTSETSKLFYAADFAFLSQLTPSYPGTAEAPGVLLDNVADTLTLSKFFSPAIINFSLGMDYKPNDVFSLFYSPAAYKGIYVADDAIAALNVHGNEEGKNTFHNLGSLIRAIYTNKFAKDKLLFTSNLSLYSNYLQQPENIDVDWQNQLDFEIIKNLNLSVLVNVFYDHDVLVQVTDYDAPNGVSGVGRRVNLTQQLLIKYTRQF